MTLLILGLILWTGAHFFKRLMPQARARMGKRGNGVVAIAILASVVLMVIGYRGAEVSPVYSPIPGIGHLNNLLMLVSIFLFGAGGAGGVVASKLRHPMLLGMLAWVGAHLLVNGDLASIVLFGGLGLWAIAEIAIINRAQGKWSKTDRGPISKDIRVGIVAIVLFAVITAIHTWLGYSPFLGTYG